MPDPTEGQLPAPSPVVTAETEPFWDATLHGKLMLQRCVSCQAVIWYPRFFCPTCHSTDPEWFEASGRGEVYSFAVVRRGDGPYAGAGPYVLAYVELDEGPRMMTNLVDFALDEVEIGTRVQVVFHDTGHGSALPRFRLEQPG